MKAETSHALFYQRNFPIVAFAKWRIRRDNFRRLQRRVNRLQMSLASKALIFNFFFIRTRLKIRVISSTRSARILISRLRQTYR